MGKQFMNAAGRFFILTDALQQGPFGIFHMLLGHFPGHGTIVFGNVFDHLPMFFPGRGQAARIVHGNGTEAQHLFAQIVEDIDEALVTAGVIEDVVETDIGIDDLIKFVIVDIFVDLERIRSRYSSSSGVIRSAARPAASSSRALRISKTWAISFKEISATYVPRRGTMTTKPSSSNLRIASRIGVRLTPSSSANWISMSRSPGLSTPSLMAWRSVSLTTSRSVYKHLI